MTSAPTQIQRWAFTSPLPSALKAGDIHGNEWWTTSNPAPDHTNQVGFVSFPRTFCDAPPALVVTDIDSTLIHEEVIDELAAIAGCHDEVAEITSRAMNGELDFETSLRQRVALLEGLPVQAFEEVAQSVTITSGAKELVDWVHRHGGKFGVVSGGFTPVAKSLAQRLGIDHVLAIDLEERGGRLTGKTIGPIVDAHAKVQAIKTWSAGNVGSVIAVGDGANDIPMLTSAGVGIAFCAKPAVKQSVHNFLDLRSLDAVAGLLGYNPAL